MTSANISNLLAKQTAATSAQGAGIQNTRNVNGKENAQDMFSNLMNQTTADHSIMTPPAKSQTNVSVPTGTSSADTLTGRDNRSIKQVDSSNKIDTIKEKLNDKTEEFSDKVKDVIEDELDVTEEEIEKAMTSLGLSMMELTDPSNLAKLIAELEGSTDQTQLLMSDGFQNVLQQVEVLTENLMAELGIDSKQFQELIAGMEQVNSMGVEETSQMDGQLETLTATEETGALAQQTDTQSGNLTSAITDHSTAEQKTVVTSNDDQTKDMIVAEDENQTALSPEDAESQLQNGGEDTDENSQTTEQPAQKLTTQHENVTGNLDHAVPAQFTTTAQTTPIADVPVMPVTQVDVESIIDQIAEFSRTVATQSGTTLEMQLNPENLGKIYMQISTTKEGNVTAQLAAQNEAVKEALESQVATLRENLNQQGIKVDSIEITVSSHELERNLDQNARQQEQQGEQQEASRGSARRNLNLNNLDELAGLMTEEEMLAAKIMQDNGNSMDVIA